MQQSDSEEGVLSVEWWDSVEGGGCRMYTVLGVWVFVVFLWEAWMIVVRRQNRWKVFASGIFLPVCGMPLSMLPLEVFHRRPRCHTAANEMTSPEIYIFSVFILCITLKKHMLVARGANDG